jgi:hypothetical protein
LLTTNPFSGWAADIETALPDREFRVRCQAGPESRPLAYYPNFT